MIIYYIFYIIIYNYSYYASFLSSLARIIRCSYLEKSPNPALPSTMPLASTHRQHRLSQRGKTRLGSHAPVTAEGHLQRTRNHGSTLKEKQAATQPSRKAVFRPRQSANSRFKSYHGLQLSESFQILPLDIETFFLPL